MRAAILFCAGFAAAAALTAAGAFTRIDQLAVDHLMPGLQPTRVFEPGLLDSLVPVAGADSGWSVAADLWLFPASAGLSFAIVLACAAVRRERVALVWPAALVLGTAVEAVVKETLLKPSVFADGLRVGQFDMSLPSGHTLRAVIVAAAVAETGRRAAPYAWAWAATVPFVLVAAGWHPPSDILAGLLLAGALVLAAQHLERRRVDRRARDAGAVEDGEPSAAEPQRADVVRR
jgi:membrane-associated phospholipid phosphatase